MESKMRGVLRVSAMLVALFMAACGEFNPDDQDFSDNRRTLDITNDNAEELAWSAYQAMYTPFYYSELYSYLDASDLNLNAGFGLCDLGGSYTATYPRAAGDEYEVGDEFMIEFTSCIRANGIQFDGLISGRYTELEGYNTEFFDAVGIDACAVRVSRDEFDGAARIITGQAGQVVFDKQGETVFVRYLDSASDASIAVELSVELLELSDVAVVINRSSTNPSSSLSSDGASVFMVEDGIELEVDCAFYQRDIEIDFSDFRIASSDATRLLNGKFEATDTQNTADNKILRLRSDGASTQAVLGNLLERYNLTDFDWRLEYDDQNENAYSAYFDTEFTNEFDGSIGEARTLSGSALRGELSGLLPGSGIITVAGSGSENVAMLVNSASSVTMAIEAEGDLTGDGRSDKTADNFDLSWSDFLSRNFVRPPVLPVEPPTDEIPNDDFDNLLN